MIKVAKFGGSSLASAEQFQKVRAIVEADKSRCYIVPSAPGKRFSGDTKVTDLLIKLYTQSKDALPYNETIEQIKGRYLEIAEQLDIHCNLDTEFAEIETRIQNGASYDYVVSRGEYLNAVLLAAYLDFPFIDAAEVVFFDSNGDLEADLTNRVMERRLARLPRAVIPGFYGSMPNGSLKLFSRGGSDISGSLVARAAHADLYENWTDVSGFLMADPRIVSNPLFIDTITYRELRDLSYMGASVLHEDAIFPVKIANIPINIRNTNRPDDDGTMIVPFAKDSESVHAITGIAGRKDLSVVHLEKDRMDAIPNYVSEILHTFAELNLPFSYLPASIDALDIILHRDDLAGCSDRLLAALQEKSSPDQMEIISDMALFAIVGHSLKGSVGTAAKLLSALAEASINVRLIGQNCNERSIIVGVKETDLEKAIQKVYEAFVR